MFHNDKLLERVKKMSHVIEGLAKSELNLSYFSASVILHHIRLILESFISTLWCIGMLGLQSGTEEDLVVREKFSKASNH